MHHYLGPIVVAPAYRGHHFFVGTWPIRSVYLSGTGPLRKPEGRSSLSVSLTRMNEGG